MTTAVLLRSGMMRKYHVPFWRAVEEATPSLTLIILELALRTVGHTGTLNVSGENDLCTGEETPQCKPTRGKRKPKQ